MSTMIPDKISANRDNEDEREVFEKLRAGPTDWVVIHSAKVPQGANQRDREIDFVILTGPAVICLEVKGGLFSRQGNQWFNGRGEPTDDPIEQARSGMFALKNHVERDLLEKIPEALKNTVGALRFEYALLLTHPEMVGRVKPTLPKNKSEAWLLLHRDSLEDVGAFHEKLSTFAASKLRASPRRIRDVLTGPFGAALVPKAQDKLRELLTPPDFDGTHVRVSKGGLNRINSELIKLTEQQNRAFRSCTYNDRVVVDGAAGTGKTILAVGLAQQRINEGDRVLLLVGRSRNLSQWVAKQSLPPNVVASTNYFVPLQTLLFGSGSPSQKRFERAFNRMCKKYQDVLYVSDTLDEHTVERLQALEGESRKLAEQVAAEFAVSGHDAPFDYLIVDEAQSTPEWTLPMLNSLVDGGLEDGRWAIFGDFTNQNMYPGPSGEIDLREALPLVYPRIRWTNDRLTINCRNARPIFDAFSGLATSDSYEVSDEWQVDGPKVSIRYYSSRTGESDELSKTVAEFQKKRLPLDRIVVLGSWPYDRWLALTNGREEYEGQRSRDITYDYDKLSSGGLNYCYSLLFQGLESEIVIVLFGESGGDDELGRKSCYTSLSRAKSHLVIIAHESNRPLLERAMRT